MSTTTKFVSATPDEVFEILVRPETYPDWLVGAREIRAVDDGWPAVGTRFHHRVGVGPLTLADSTKVIAILAPEMLCLEVRARPLGRAKATFHLAPADGGTTVTLEEVPIGPLAAVRPALDPLATARNTRSLDNLARLVDSMTVD